jgi:Zn-dependent M28 family amino/carboxypeptidase
VAHPLRPLETTRAVINLDMIGRDEKPSAQTKGLMEIAADTSNELNLIGLKSSPALRAALERANREVGLRLSHKWDEDAALNVPFRCDHFSFLLKRVPAVWLFNGFQPDYHQPTDSIEKLNFAKMQKIVRLAHLAGRALAQAE